MYSIKNINKIVLGALFGLIIPVSQTLGMLTTTESSSSQVTYFTPSRTHQLLWSAGTGFVVGASLGLAIGPTIVSSFFRPPAGGGSSAIRPTVSGQSGSLRLLQGTSGSGASARASTSVGTVVPRSSASSGSSSFSSAHGSMGGVAKPVLVTTSTVVPAAASAAVALSSLVGGQTSIRRDSSNSSASAVAASASTSSSSSSSASVVVTAEYRAKLKANQLHKLHTIPEDSITKLYKLINLCPIPIQLYIPKAQLTTPQALKEHLMALGVIENFSNSQELFDSFMKGAKDIEAGKELSPEVMLLSLEKLVTLRTHATSILKAFLPENQDDVAVMQGQFKKIRFERLFTYAQLQRVIIKNKLSLIDLSLDMLLIKDKKTNRYIVGQEASEILDKILYVSVFPDTSRSAHAYCHLRLSELSDYEFRVWSFEEPRSKIPMSLETLMQLQKLVAIAPFDVGGTVGDNIFSRDDGSAVIIDTEYPGFTAEMFLPYLENYNRTGRPLPTYHL